MHGLRCCLDDLEKEYEMKLFASTRSPLIDTVGANVDGGIRGWAADLVADVKRRMEERSVIRQISQLDDAMLRDIGVADDEISRVRRQEAFTPRAWL
jgi:uncharacterized protein YjiS (DUF1127 family)